MRPVQHGDVSAAARLLWGTPAPLRPGLCARLITEAEIADRHMAATGRLHPLFGNGSLMGAARKRALPDEPGFDNAEYCTCFALVLESLADRCAGRGPRDRESA